MTQRGCLPGLVAKIRNAADVAREHISPDDYIDLYWVALALEMKRPDVLVADRACCPCCEKAR